jgi:hypothetical protein
MANFEKIILGLEDRALQKVMRETNTAMLISAMEEASSAVFPYNSWAVMKYLGLKKICAICLKYF